MQISSLFRVLIFLIVVLVCCMPFFAFTQQAPEYTEAVAHASRDAALDIDTRLWFVAGCMLGPLGIVSASVIEGAKPPASRFIGRSPEYVALYTDTYKAKILSLQSKSATDGCLTSFGISAAFTVYWLLLRAGVSF